MNIISDMAEPTKLYASIVINSEAIKGMAIASIMTMLSHFVMAVRIVETLTFVLYVYQCPT